MLIALTLTRLFLLKGNKSSGLGKGIRPKPTRKAELPQVRGQDPKSTRKTELPHFLELGETRYSTKYSTEYSEHLFCPSFWAIFATRAHFLFDLEYKYSDEFSGFMNTAVL